MLNSMRKSATTWVGIPVLVLAIGAMVVTMFQPQGPLVSGDQAGNVAATIGKSALLDSEYSSAVERAAGQERQQQPDMTTAAFLDAGGGRMVLDQLIRGKALDAFGAANGLVVSRRMVDGEIASIPAFQLNGRFDDATFRRVLDEQRIGERELRQSIATDLMQRQLLQPVMLGAHVPTAMAERYALLLLEQRQGEILPVPSAAAADPGTPTDAQLQAFHDANSAAYTIPERRAFRFAEIDDAALVAKAKPTADEVRGYYDQHPAEFGGVETRDVRQIVLIDEAKAKAFVEKVRGGTEFQKAAADEGFSSDDTGLGRLGEAALAEEVGEAAATAAFALAANGVSDPVQAGYGWQVMFVGGIHAAQATPFAAVSAEIEQRLAGEKLQQLVADNVATAEDALEDGQSLADVAQSLGLAVQSAPALTRDGRLVDENYTVNRVDQPLLPQVFAASQSDGPQVVEYGDSHYALLEVTDVIQPVLVPLEKIRGDVAAAWAVKARFDAAGAMADRIAKAASDGKTMREAIGADRLPPVQPLTIRRLELTQMVQQGQEVPLPVLMLLNTPQGQARAVAAPDNQGWFVVKVNEVTAGDAAEAAPMVDSMRQSLMRDTAQELADRFVRAVEGEVKVVRQPAVIEEADRRMHGDFLDE